MESDDGANHAKEKRLVRELSFDAIRSDWYAANSLIPRLIVKAVRDREPLRLIGFPTQWIPVCAHYGLLLEKARPPAKYMPLFSDLSSAEIWKYAIEAKSRGWGRSLLEATAALDPIVADLIYIVDHKLAAAGFTTPSSEAVNHLNTWHSFCRPEIVQLQSRMCRHIVEKDTLLLLPCSRHRPYHESRTHNRILRELAKTGHDAGSYSLVVVTALGVVPEPYWSHPLVMSYDAGAVDLWRIFQLQRTFFTTNPSRKIVDCLSFKPYSDMLSLLQSLGFVAKVTRPLKLNWRSFHVRLP